MGKRLTAVGDRAVRAGRLLRAHPRPVRGGDAARCRAGDLERVEQDLGGPLAGRLSRQAAPALHLARRPGPPPRAARCRRGRDRPRHPLLEQPLLHQGERQSPGFVSWHQDATYWGLSEPDVVTAWVAFTESTPANGNMRVIPGSHRAPVAHVDTFHPDNLLSRGQEITVEVDEATRGGHRAGGGGDVAAPRADRPRLRGEPVGRPPHRIRHPLRPDARPTDGGAPRQRIARAGLVTRSATSIPAAPRRRSRPGDARPPRPRSATGRRRSSTGGRRGRGSDAQGYGLRRTVSTGHGASRTTFSATEPSST